MKRNKAQSVFVFFRFVVNEMIQSEKDYVKDLAVIVEVRSGFPPHVSMAFIFI